MVLKCYFVPSPVCFSVIKISLSYQQIQVGFAEIPARFFYCSGGRIYRIWYGGPL